MVNKKIDISPLAEDEVEQLVTLVNSAYRGESSKKGWTTEAHLLDGIRTDITAIDVLLKNPGTQIFSARYGVGKMVGCVYLQQQGRQLYLGMLTVAPDEQDKGIGKQLLLAAENYAMEINCVSIIMTVIDIRYDLIDWYKRKGYLFTGETKPFPTDESFGIAKQPLQFVVLEKKLVG